MARLQIFQKCNIKNPEFEKYLAGINEKNITRSKVYTDGEFNKLLQITTPHDILPLKVYPNPHSVILVKNKYLPNGYSIFDANGYVDGPRGSEYVDILNIPFYIVSKDSTYESFDQVSPQRALNRGSNSINPGYCGIFGIIFMVYFKNTSDIEGWNIPWIDFINKAREPFAKNIHSDSFALQLASDVQLIIKNNTNYLNMEIEIIDVIKLYFNKLNIKFPSETVKRQRTSFGKNKYKHNGREYVVHIGPRGGKYIIVKNVKKYI